LKERFVKKSMLFLAMVFALLVAMPVAASPPDSHPLQLAELVVGQALGPLVLAPVLVTALLPIFETIPILSTRVIDNAITLAGLMHGADSNYLKSGIAEGYRLSASNSIRANDGSRRWV
jgi:hypothetical protein